jgi:hypothetical protein
MSARTYYTITVDPKSHRSGKPLGDLLEATLKAEGVDYCLTSGVVWEDSKDDYPLDAEIARDFNQVLDPT